MTEETPKKQNIVKETKTENTAFGRTDVILLIILTVIFLALRLPRLSYVHPNSIVHEGTGVKHTHDEYYYVPAAKTYLTSQPDSNPNHPPLAKMLMAVFIKIFGDNPIGWRMGSIVFGFGSLVLTYLFALALFKSRPAAFFSGLLLALDFLQIVQSRIATIDVYVSFFMLGGIYFSYLYASGEKKPEIHKWSILSAVFLGLALGCKLSALSAILAVFVYFVVIALVKKKFTIKNAAVLTLLYGGIIALIYIGVHVPLFMKGAKFSYIFYRDTLNLHYNMPFEHPRLARMWQWILVMKNFYYQFENDNAARTSVFISAMGSYLFWWGFLLFFVRKVYQAIRDKKEKDLLLVVSYLCLYLFWLTSFQIKGGHFRLKGGFFYYMLPLVPIMALTVGEVMGQIWKKNLGKACDLTYVGGLLWFLYRFFPMLTGIEKPMTYFMGLFSMNIYTMIFIVLALNLQLLLPFVPISHQTPEEEKP